MITSISCGFPQMNWHIQLTISCVLTTIESDISFETLLSQNSSAFALYLLCCVFIIPICKKLYLFSVLVCVLKVTKLRAFIHIAKQTSEITHSL